MTISGVDNKRSCDFQYCLVFKNYRNSQTHFKCNNNNKIRQTRIKIELIHLFTNKIISDICLHCVNIWLTDYKISNSSYRCKQRVWTCCSRLSYIILNDTQSIHRCEIRNRFSFGDGIGNGTVINVWICSCFIQIANQKIINILNLRLLPCHHLHPQPSC